MKTIFFTLILFTLNVTSIIAQSNDSVIDVLNSSSKIDEYNVKVEKTLETLTIENFVKEMKKYNIDVDLTNKSIDFVLKDEDFYIKINKNTKWVISKINKSTYMLKGQYFDKHNNIKDESKVIINLEKQTIKYL